jgi:uncharacterized membrane protein
MTEGFDLLSEHWLSLLMLLSAAVLGVRALFAWKRTRRPAIATLILSATFACLGIGDFVVPADWAWWIGGGSLAALFLMVIALVITGHWSAYLASILSAVLLVALGSLALGPAGRGLDEIGKTIASLEATQPWWLLLLGFVPLIIFWSYRSLAGLGPVRRWLAIGLRCAIVILLAMALAEVRIRHHNENITVFFVVDRSFSIPEEYDSEPSPEATRIDRRWDRVEKFINETVRQRGSNHKFDRAGLILFGRRPRLELPASNAPSFNFRFKDAATSVDGYYTDIAAAIKLALASFPEGTGKRIVLISDGNENLGNAEEQARIAERNGAQIDVVPLAAGYKSENEVLVQSVEAPSRTEQGSRLPIRVLLRSYHPRPVYGTLRLKQITDGLPTQVPGSPAKIKLLPGLNSFSFQQPLTSQQQSYTYEAIFEPEAVDNERGERVPGLKGDRVQNNVATTHVVALGQRRILIVEQREGEHQLLLDRLHAVGNSKYKVLAIPASKLPEKKDDLGVFLSNYDCLILANVPAELLSEDQQEMIRSNTHDQGCGLIMIGGPEGFGAGGWQSTPVEKALPVDCEIKSIKVQGKGGLAMIMHASEMSDGNRWQKEIAKLAIKKLSPADEVGILHYDWGVHKWHIPLQVIGGKKGTLLSAVDRMVPGDMPDFDGPLKMAYDSLTEESRMLATKHVIIISDGDPMLSNSALLRQMKSKKVTVSTVGVATHGASQDAALESIARGTGGRFYKVTNARALPAIYTKETRIVSQSFLYERAFQPRLMYRAGPTDKLPDVLRNLYGFVRTTPKQSPLVELPILGPPAPDFDFPILAYWMYGLGKAVAFTSDARGNRWDREWAGSEMYSKFWEQMVDYALRPTETGRLTMVTDYHDGKVKVTIDARDEKNRPLTDLNLQGGVTSPSAKQDEAHAALLKFEQKNSGYYEAEFKADEAGSYFINAQAKRAYTAEEKGKTVQKEEVDSIRSGVTIPYSPEFADFESNTALLEKIRDLTGGKSFSEELLAQAADPNSAATSQVQADLAQDVFRSGLPEFRSLQPVWYWLLFIASLLFFFDIAVRRIAVQPNEVAAGAQRVWEKLRGRAVAVTETPQFIDRLQSRKAKVTEALEQLRAAKRFEAPESVGAAPPGAQDEMTVASAPAPRAAVQPRIAPQKEEEAADYASRLLKAKKRVWEERDQSQP